MPRSYPDPNKCFALFLQGHSFRDISRKLESAEIDVARAIGKIADVEWAYFRGAAV